MKIELHSHTSQTSPCSHISAEQIAALHKAAGYDAIVITDHYSKWVMDSAGISDAEEFTEYFLNGYRSALQHAPSGIRVFLGGEISLTESPNDYLLYGATENFFKDNPLLFKLSLKELYNLCQANDILLIQAHPNRSYCTPSDPDFLNGVEVYNGNPRHNSKNEKTLLWAEKHSSFIRTSGSDFHEMEDLDNGGILTSKEITNEQELVKLLKSGDYNLIAHFNDN